MRVNFSQATASLMTLNRIFLWKGLFAFLITILGLSVPIAAQTSSAGRAVFSMEASSSSVEVGSVIDLTISLGSESAQLTGVNGIGFELHQQGNAFSLDEIIWHDFPADEANSIRFAEVFPGTGNYGISVSRTDGAGSDGFGSVVTVRLRLEQSFFDGYEFSVENALVINASGAPFTAVLPENVVVTEAVVTPRVPGIVQLLSPPDAETDLDVSPEFVWQLRSDASSYDFEIALDPNFTFGRQGITTQEDRTLLENPLDYESTYFWRVRGVNDAGAGEWSVTRVFGTKSLPLPPSRVFLLTPANQQTDVSITPAFEWFAVTGASGYQFELSQDPGFASGVTAVETQDVSLVVEQELDYESVYFWRVRAVNEVGSGQWSAIRVFSTVENPQPGLVTLLQPGNGEFGVTITPEFNWFAAQRANNYEIQVSETADFSVNAQSATTTATSITLTENLAYDRVYFWRVRALNDTGSGEWSDIRIFTTEEEPLPPTRVNLEQPANRDFSADITPLFSWLQAFGAESYTFQLSTDPGFLTLVSEVTQEDVQLVLTDALNYETTYYWRVRATNAIGEGPWSATRLFVTIADPTPKPPQRVFLVAPANQAQSVSRLPLFSWLASENATSYDVELATDPAFTSNLQQVNTTDSFLQLASELAYETVYYWRVRGVNEAGSGAWSLTRIFITEVDPMPGITLLLLPANGQFDVSTTPTLGWSTARSAQSYTYEVASDPLFASVVASGSQSGTSVTLTEELDHERTHFWRVRAVNDLGNGDWSDTKIFTTEAAPVLPGRIALTSPSNQAAGVAVTPTFQWNADPAATSYEVFLARDAGFSTEAVSETVTANTWSPVNPLLPNTLYFWMVRGLNDNGAGEWSFIYVFTTEAAEEPQASSMTAISGAAPARSGSTLIASETTIPNLVSPATGDTDVNELPLLTWSTVTGATSYEYALSTDVSFATGVVSASVTETQFQFVEALSFETSYFWRVRATVDGQTGDWSTISLFTTRPDPTPDPVVPPRVQLDAPANQATDIAVTTSVSWLATDNTDSYRVEIYSDVLLSTLVADGETTSTSFTPSTALSYSTNYYWRVRGINTVGNGEWSTLRLFTTESDPDEILQPPVAMTLSSPFTGSEGVSKTAPEFTWQAMDGASNYRLEISSEADFSSVLHTATTDQPSHTLSDGSLNFATLYYWRVNASNTAGDGEWSSTWLFTTEPDPVLPAVQLSGPGNGVESVSALPELTWQADDRATSYEIQLSPNIEFQDGTLARTSSSTSLVLDEQLGYSALYYWRVRAMNETTPGAWSSVWIFTTEADPTPALPARAELIAPDNQAVEVSETPTLSWSAAEGADSYTVAISGSPSFETNIVLQEGITQTELTLGTALSYGTTYYWRVQSVNTAGTADWSLIYVFTTQADPTPEPTALAAAELVSPVIGAAEVTVTPTLVWRSVATATAYELQVTPSSDFSTDVFTSQQADTSAALTDLGFETTYYWRVRPIRDAETGPWSQTRIFTTESDPDQSAPLPVRVTLNAPANLSADVAISPELVWLSSANAESYEIQLGIDPTFATTLLAETATDTTLATSLTLAYETVHFWRVRAVNATGNGDWSSTWSFTTQPDPTPPQVAPGRITQLLPADAATDVELRPVLTWQADETADGYTVEVSESPLFTSILISSTEAGTLFNAGEDLSYGTTYYWRVRASNEAGVGPWSTIRNFTTLSFFSPFALLGPSDGATLMIQGDENDEIVISWEPAPTAATASVIYTFYILASVEDALEDALHQLTSDGDGSETTLTVTVAALQQLFGLSNGQNTDVFWTVVAATGDEQREASERFALRAEQGVVTDIPVDGTIPASFTLAQNFPNPFNPSTSISYAIPDEQHVYLAVYDMLGRQISVLVNQAQAAGTYSVTWNASELSSGIYLYRMEAGTFMQTRRMMLVK